MRALRLLTGGALAIEDVEARIPDAGEALVAIDAVGVCRTDWHLWRGDWGWEGISLSLPRTLGHEVAGTVAAAGPGVPERWIGRRVTLPFHLSCGRCEACRSGSSEVCSAADYLGSSVDGGFAEGVLVPRAELNLVALPDWLASDSAAALGCRYMTAFHAITLQGRVGPGDWVAVFGAGGGVGLCAVQILAALGALPVAVDISAEKLEAARRQGAAASVDAREPDVAGRIVDITGGGAHVALDGLGSSQTILTSVRALRARGRHVQIGLTSADDSGSVDMPVDLFVLKELEFIGSAGNPHHRYEALFRLLRASGADPGQLISRRVGLSDVPAVFEDMSAFRSTGLVVVTDLHA